MVEINKKNGWALYGSAVSQKLPVNVFKWKNNVSKFDEDFIAITMKIVIKDIFLK